jgi:hypothetical protein
MEFELIESGPHVNAYALHVATTKGGITRSF